jgi:hypothetical protein
MPEVQPLEQTDLLRSDDDDTCEQASSSTRKPSFDRSRKFSSTRHASIGSLHAIPFCTSNNADLSLPRASNTTDSSQSLPESGTRGSSFQSSSPRSSCPSPGTSSHAVPTMDNPAVLQQGCPLQPESSHKSHATIQPMLRPQSHTLRCNTFINALKPALATPENASVTPRNERTSSRSTDIVAAMARGSFLEAPTNIFNTSRKDHTSLGSNSIAAAMARGPFLAARLPSSRSSRGKTKARVRRNTKVCS